MMRRSASLALRARGPLAVFTRPEFKVERMSYPVMTPSAARGILEAVLWKPAMRWHVERIAVLKPIEFTSFRRNEVNGRAVAPPGQVVASGGEVRMYFADDDRAQRNTVALRDVDYLVEACISLTDRARADDTIEKFAAMFRRRLDNGQSFHQPYLGCRECAADVVLPDGTEVPIDDSRDLGWMLWDIEYGQQGHRARFFRGCLERGVLVVPSEPDDRTDNEDGAA